jgi:hypothetical protein
MAEPKRVGSSDLPEHLRKELERRAAAKRKQAK